VDYLRWSMRFQWSVGLRPREPISRTTANSKRWQQHGAHKARPPTEVNFLFVSRHFHIEKRLELFFFIGNWFKDLISHCVHISHLQVPSISSASCHHMKFSHHMSHLSSLPSLHQCRPKIHTINNFIHVHLVCMPIPIFTDKEQLSSHLGVQACSLWAEMIQEALLKTLSSFESRKLLQATWTHSLKGDWHTKQLAWNISQHQTAEPLGGCLASVWFQKTGDELQISVHLSLVQQQQVRTRAHHLPLPPFAEKRTEFGAHDCWMTTETSSKQQGMHNCWQCQCLEPS